MKGELNSKSTFVEIEAYFIDNMEFLPACLDAELKYYKNVKYTAELYIQEVNCEIERLGLKRISESAVAKSSKQKLYLLYVDLQNLEGWDKPLSELRLESKMMYYA